ncbi:uncharacterized protein LOC127251539 [Andrographis paniculata]|uniref:uncharacterized protein LOC127251539 n=1 Tax=Andrographis paniculata TaxID=175694 RepID=UPI0021E8A6F1|nr:uncharacterized protein LOC127251539 [Andrographis paniculata]
MAYFKDVSSPSGNAELVICEFEGQPLDKATRLLVHPPLIGRGAARPRLEVPNFPKAWSRNVAGGKHTLQSSLHQHVSNDVLPLPTLGRRIMDGACVWNGLPSFDGNFSYVAGYWEWAEDVLDRCEIPLKRGCIYDAVYASLFSYDYSPEIVKAVCEAWCPKTNTLLTAAGEVSISLRDLASLAGLPILGSFYEEVVPSAKELYGSKEDRKLVPRSCRYLLHAYHLLRSRDKGRRGVRTTDWISFWCEKTVKYERPQIRRGKESTRSSRPDATYNPTGEIGAHEPWSKAQESSFAKLKVGREHLEETFLAAFLSCWLCIFVLPLDDVGLIRPSTFKMASVLASGFPVSLAIPVLTSIYRGLNQIADSSCPGQVRSTIPLHFLTGWIAEYFQTHYGVWKGIRGPGMVKHSGAVSARAYRADVACRKILRGDYFRWACTMITKDFDVRFVDDGKREDYEQEYFISIRSCFLTLRDGFRCFVEPYSPHRFCRQFGFFQEIPGVLLKDVRCCAFEEGYQHWHQSTYLKSSAEVILPRIPAIPRGFSSDVYKKWWTQVCGSFLDKYIPPVQKTTDQTKPSDKARKMPLLISGVPERNNGNSSTHNVGSSKRTVPSVSERSSSEHDVHWKRARRDPHIINPSSPRSSRHHSSSNFARELEQRIPSMDEKMASRDSIVEVIGESRGVCNKQVKDAPTKPIVVHSVVPAVSEFCGANFVKEIQREYIGKVWSDLRGKLLRTPARLLSSIKDEVDVVLQSMKSFQYSDISHIEDRVKALFDDAASFDEACSDSIDAVSLAARNQQISEIKDRLSHLETRHVEECEAIKELEGCVENIDVKLRSLQEQKRENVSLIKRRQGVNENITIQIAEVKDELAAVENVPAQDEEYLKSLEELLDISKEELYNLNV